MRKVFVAIFVLLLIGAGASWAVLAHRQSDDHPTSISASLSRSDQKRLELTLNSTNRNRQASVMTPDLRAAYLAQGHSILPTGVRIKLKPNTFIMNGNAAHVKASITIPGGASTTYTLLLVRTNAHSPWLLINTEGM